MVVYATILFAFGDSHSPLVNGFSGVTWAANVDAVSGTLSELLDSVHITSYTIHCICEYKRGMSNLPQSVGLFEPLSSIDGLLFKIFCAMAVSLLQLLQHMVALQFGKTTPWTLWLFAFGPLISLCNMFSKVSYNILSEELNDIVSLYFFHIVAVLWRFSDATRFGVSSTTQSSSSWVSMPVAIALVTQTSLFSGEFFQDGNTVIGQDSIITILHSLKWLRRSLWAMKATFGFWWAHVACAFLTVGFDPLP